MTARQLLRWLETLPQDVLDMDVAIEFTPSDAWAVAGMFVTDEQSGLDLGLDAGSPVIIANTGDI